MENIILYTFLFITIIQIIYSIGVELKLAVYKPKTQSDFEPPVSVIVAVHNEPENIQRLIDMLEKQVYHDFEIIVVDDRSDEDENDFFYTDPRYKNGTIKLVRVDETPNHISSKKYALTLGVKAAKNEHLLFTDADCIPSSEYWISEMVKTFGSETQIVLGVSPYQKKSTFLNYIIRCETFYTATQYLSFKLAGMPYMGVGRNLAYTKPLFFKSKGFSKHQSLIGGDDDLFVNENACSKNSAICISKNAHTISIPKTTWKDWLVQKSRHLSVGKHYKFKHRLILGLQSFSHVLFWAMSLYALTMVTLHWQENNWLYYTVLCAFFLRILIKNIILSVISKKIQVVVKWYELLLFDFLYNFYIMFLGTKALFTKTAKWS